MFTRGRLPLAAQLLVVIAVVGTVGYMITDDLSVLDAVYQTIMTVSTVGFSEPEGGFTGAGKILAIFLVIGGVGALFYTAAIAFELGLERIVGGGLTRFQRKEISRLKDHVILCGFGNVGSNAYQLLAQHNAHVVVIESDPTAVSAAREINALVIEGDATLDETLLEAGLERATALVASVQSDADNLVIVLSARSRRPDLLIVARATDAESESKLRLAGADRVVSPQVVAAHRLASLAVQPELADFIDFVVQGELLELRVERCVVAEGSRVAGRTLQQSAIRQISGASVLAIRTLEGTTEVNPQADRKVLAGEALIGVGSQQQVDALRRLALGSEESADV